MLGTNIKMAWASIKSTRWRSLLTVLGIIIGIVSVVTTVSLGQGVKQQVVGQIHDLGEELITVRPGKLVNRDAEGKVTDINLTNLLSTGNLTEQDLAAVQKSEGIAVAIPLSLVTGTAKVEDREYSSGFISATTPQILEILNKKIAFGEFFKAEDDKKNVVVIGRSVAEELFMENVPIGQNLQIRGQTFVVRGVLEEFETSPLAPHADYNSAIFIPYEVGKKLSNGQSQIYQILVKPAEGKDVNTTIASINTNLLASHGGQNDFTVLKQDENLAVADRVLTLLTSMIAGVAAISLVVGGIGIMNVMLVSVTERTHEIGVRKAIGATNRQILGQFIIEAAILSLSGGFLGVLASILINYLLRIFTDLQPVITISVVLVATGVAFLVGLLFGAMPAFKAARKDPIEALRRH